MNRPKSAGQQRSPPRTDDPATIKTLAGILKMSQTEAAADFFEESFSDTRAQPANVLPRY
jgi:hypothetical protein